jgi:hypothetical protein
MEFSSTPAMSAVLAKPLRSILSATTTEIPRAEQEALSSMAKQLSIPSFRCNCGSVPGSGKSGV